MDNKYMGAELGERLQTSSGFKEDIFGGPLRPVGAVSSFEAMGTVGAVGMPKPVEKDANLYNPKPTFFTNKELIHSRNIGNPAITMDLLEAMALTPRRVSSGIEKLDNVLGGGYKIGINVVGGLPGVGKTTLMLQSALKMSDAGKQVVYISKDMREPEILAKLLSYVSYELYSKDCYSMSDIADRAEVLKPKPNNPPILAKHSVMARNLAIVDVLKPDVAQYFNNLADAEDISLLEAILKLYSDAYKTPVFFIDCLQQFAKELNFSAKENVDKLLNAFKSLSAKYDVPIVLISTLNRASYGKDLDLAAFKESGDIDYDSDTIIAVQPKFEPENEGKFNMDEFRAQVFRPVEVKNLKLRDGGAVREEFCFYTRGNAFLDSCAAGGWENSNDNANSNKPGKTNSQHASKSEAPKVKQRKTGGAFV